MTTALSVDARTRRRLGLRSAVVARGALRRLDGRRTFRVRFTRDARRRIVRLRGIRFRLVSVGTELKGARRVTLKRSYVLVKRKRR